jgi:hypothetical protein
VNGCTADAGGAKDRNTRIPKIKTRPARAPAKTRNIHFKMTRSGAVRLGAIRPADAVGVVVGDAVGTDVGS